MYNNPDSFLGKELKETEESLEKVINCEAPWGRILEYVRKNYAWDFEEATAMQINKNKDLFYEEVYNILKSNFSIQDEVLNNLIKFQKDSIVDPNIVYPNKKEYEYNFYEVVSKKEKLIKNKKHLQFNSTNYDGDYYKWGTEVLWWGRRVAACKTKIEDIS